MSGEFQVVCDGCEKHLVVCAFPKCPKCGLSASLCEKCMPKHNCKAARKEAMAWNQLQNKD
ncbi:MAG: hypothetical protein A3G49_04805 [Candidatus Sungbacteria bacterium RIFCSPLOWO2_12_FULL_41_11]|uniref:Uncharacterized protein n=1 Tax=Candidatus Sungbacteria bacterium RIFCSPLOWO2_12_FULL_41_11 TaxID=1802286 RepID=A0A1G2LN35_9BACT|nr:MAG: hypothetical protein UV01_C0004G0006 [Parcubacteria group bacterium GW2011_GWA2_42_14]OGZ99629.1 MAG: hypothetical protein A3D41_05775 [Candidatus Sungbacteria bacterium RIFCSPHIGHO2_02_FULL_41_12b]OHA13027.1 MAG: hypothetical protein A3G49_04805 [Candidatus Sungbacteria bacterium RIFCSPLOWO2_12_FULL_41_11]